MSLFTTRTAPRPTEQRDIQTLPWVNGETVPTPLQSVSTYGYSTEDAFKIAAVVACVGMRAGAFAQLPLKGYQDTTGGYADLLAPQPELLVSPSSVVVPSVWKTQMSISRDIWGYAVAQITAVDAAGYVSKAEWLSPSVCRARQQFVGGPLEWTINGHPVDSSSLLHIPSRWVTPGNPLGMSPLEKSGLVSLAKMAQDFGRDWFLKGAVPSAILYSDKELTAAQADTLLERVYARWRRRQMAILGKGLEYKQVSVAANESQFLDTMRQASADIAISFNLPPSKINAATTSGGKIEYGNIDQNQAQFLIDSINPDLVVVQEVVTQFMRSGTDARWNTSAFLRSDLRTRYESYQVGLATGFLEKNEVRALEDMPPLPTNDVAHSQRWQEVWLPTLVAGGIMTTEEARATLGLPPEPTAGTLSAPDAAAADSGTVENTPRQLAEMVQKLYLGVGIVITDQEARQILNSAGGNFPGALPAPGGAPA